MKLFNVNTGRVWCVSPGILMQMESSTDDDDAATLEMKSDLLLTLSALCENDMHRKARLS